MSCATEGFSARIAMVLDSLASIGNNPSLQRPALSIASLWNRKCRRTWVVTLDLPFRRNETQHGVFGRSLMTLSCDSQVITSVDLRPRNRNTILHGLLDGFVAGYGFADRCD